MTEPTPKRKRRPRKARDISGNQGEGNREADRRYREKASEFAKSDRAERAANEAQRAMEGDAARDAGAREQLEDLDRAEREARRDAGKPEPREGVE